MVARHRSPELVPHAHFAWSRDHRIGWLHFMLASRNKTAPSRGFKGRQCVDLLNAGGALRWRTVLQRRPRLVDGR